MNEKYGHWEVNGSTFNNKYAALLSATQSNSAVTFKYHTAVWKSFNRRLLGKTPLSVLYKERAQQIRDRYQYLILYYSGGADSHNILRTYIDNNIKLDEICVKWPKALIDSNIYSPNFVDRSARNYWSEWDYAIKPVLQWIAANKPDIKITIKDYVADIDNLSIAPIFEKIDHMRSGAMLFGSVLSDTVDTMSADKIGHIYGIDKPILIQYENRLTFSFSDFATSSIFTGAPEMSNGEGFYWAPDFPLLTLEMAYQAAQHYKRHVEDRKYLHWVQGDQLWNSLVVQKQNDIVKMVCYQTWDNRFQSDKPGSPTRSDKFFWFHEHSDFSRIKQEYDHHASSRINSLNSDFVKGNTFGVCVTEPFYVDIIDP